jgi:hypothetical protein
MADVSGIAAKNVEGAAAEDAPASGNPVLTGGRFDATPRALEDGDVGAIAVDAEGRPTVVVEDIVPGVAATNLGKAEDAAHTSGDVGVMPLGVQLGLPLDGKFSDTDGDYEPLAINNQRLLTSPNLVQLIDNFADHTSWAAKNDDASTPADETTNYLAGGSAVSFNKLNGTSNTVYGLIVKNLASPVNFLNGITGAAFFQVIIYIPDLTNVVNVVLRMGTDASNYGEWKIDPATATAGQFNSFRMAITSMSNSIGTGWSGSAVDYVEVGLEFDIESRTLSGIIMDAIIFNGGNLVEADITSETSVSTANVNIQKVGNQVVNTQAGNVSNGTQRVTLATDDVNAAAIKTATETIAAAVSTEMQVDVVAALPTGANVIGNVGLEAGTNNIGDVDAGGLAAHDAPVSGNPLLQGLEARTTNPTAVGDGDAVRAMADDLGRQVVAPHAPRDRVVQQQTDITGTTETTILAAGAAGVFRDLVHIIVSNSDNNNEAIVTFRDSTGGTVRLDMAVARSGGGASLTFPVPLPQATAANV